MSEPHYITGFHANLSSDRPDTVHTMIVGCAALGLDEKHRSVQGARSMWDCGWVREPDYRLGSTCKDAATILFGERNNGQRTDFPSGVGLKVGPGTGINFLVLRIHYAKHEMFREIGDTSGISLKMVPASLGTVTKRAGLLSSGTAIPSGMQQNFH